MTRFAALLCLFFACQPGFSAAGERVTVFAAASLRGVLEEIAEGLPADVALSYGGSGTMARQVAAGAPADVAILASTDWMAWLLDRGIETAGEPQPIAANRLVLIGEANAEPIADLAALPDRLGAQRLAIGQREAVPAGIYARQWLESAGVWADVSDRLAETDNVRAALAFVARGATPFGIVYATDAAAEPRVEVLLAAPAEAHEPVLYPAAALTAEGAEFIRHLTSVIGQATFAAHGFAPVPAP